MARKKPELDAVPNYKELVNPTFNTLKKLGGFANNLEIHDTIVSMLNLTDDVVNVSHTGKNESELVYRLRWVRTWMKKAEIINNEKRGIWTITPKYADVLKLNDQEIERVMSTRQNLQKKVPSKESFENIIENITIKDKLDSAEGEPWRDELRDAITSINPYKFEDLSKIVLSECGISNIVVTQKSNDGGIDGYGKLNINELFSINIAFQCKRYGFQNKVQAKEIREFRGSLSNNIKMCLFITTSSFTQGAIDESNKPDKNEIHLMDGKMFIDKLMEHEIGVKKQIVYIVDEDFFNQFK